MKKLRLLLLLLVSVLLFASCGENNKIDNITESTAKEEVVPQFDIDDLPKPQKIAKASFYTPTKWDKYQEYEALAMYYTNDLILTVSTRSADSLDDFWQKNLELIQSDAVNYKELLQEKITTLHNIEMLRLKYEISDSDRGILTNDRYMFVEEGTGYSFEFEITENTKRDVSNDIKNVIDSIDFS